MGKQSMWWVEVPLDGTAAVDVPDGQRLVITQATLELPGGIKDSMPDWGYPRWFTVKCAKDPVQPSSAAGPPWLNVGTLSIPDDGQFTPIPMANPGFLTLRLVLDSPAIFTVVPYNHFGVRLSDGPKAAASDAPRVHLAGYLEANV